MGLLALRDENPQFNGKRKLSLYSDFRKLKEKNPDGYEANIAAWKSFLRQAIESGKLEGNQHCKFLVHLDNNFLTEMYDPTYGKPLSIDVIVDELVENKTLTPLSVFKSRKYSLYMNEGVLSWMIQQVWDTKWHSGTDKGTLKAESYVYIEKLDEIAAKVWSNIQTTSYSHSLYTKSMIYEFLQNLLPSHDLVDIVLLYLSRDKPRLQISGDIIKTTLDKEISEQDESVARLCETIHNLSKKVELLSDKIEQDTRKCKDALAKGNKKLAKYYLRSKNLAESTQNDCLQKLENLEIILNKIDGATEDIRVIKHIEDGTQLLKNIQQAIGGVDKVELLVEAFRDQTVTSDEIGEQLQQINGLSEDETELENELKQLESEAKQKKNENLLMSTVGVSTSFEEEDLSRRLEKLEIGNRKQQSEPKQLEPAQVESQNVEQSQTDEVESQAEQLPYRLYA